MFWMLPQPARREYEGNPEERGFRLSSRRGLLLEAGLAPYDGWTKQLDDA
jgi:hypothetical protein